MNHSIFDRNRESRKEARFQAAGIGDLTIVDSSRFLKLSVDIVNVSRSGFQIELDEPLESGAGVEIRLRESTAMGEVRHCHRHGTGRYRAGIATHQVIGSPLRMRHLSRADLLPFILNLALTEAQRHFYAEHLKLCAVCEQDVEKTEHVLATPG
jgi:hypothetical protein